MINKYNSCIPLFLDPKYFLIRRSIRTCCQKNELQLWVNLGPGCDPQLFGRRWWASLLKPFFLFHNSLSRSGTTWIEQETTCWAWRDWLKTSWQRSPTSWSLIWRAEALNQTQSRQPTPLAPNLQPTPSERHRWGRERFQMCGNPLKALSYKWIPLRVTVLRLHAVFGEAAVPGAALREDERAERCGRDV